jgi:hypothetical protein
MDSPSARMCFPIVLWTSEGFIPVLTPVCQYGLYFNNPYGKNRVINERLTLAREIISLGWSQNRKVRDGKR